MADDRYNWLDEDAAERLLRGERVDAGLGRGAEELDDLLDAAARTAAAPSPDTALPGEEAAVAAFRQASAGRSTRDTATAAGAAESASEDGIPVVRSVPGGGASRTSERTRLGRPFRRGLAVALAGCALGGVAVATGTGVLPTPFRGGEPGPSPSVSAAVTPNPLESRAPAPDASDGGTRAPDAGTDADPAHPATPTTPGRPDGRPTPGRDGDDEAVDIPVPDLTPGGKDADGSDQAKRKAAVLALCRDYEAGRVDSGDRDRVRRLERTAGGADRLHAFCRRYLQQNGLTGGLGGSGDTTGGSAGLTGGTGSSGDGTSGDGGPDGDSGSGGSTSGGGQSDDDESHPGYAPSVTPTPDATTATPSPESTDATKTSSATPSPTG
ncbi:hypothetical protein ABZ840_16500 [Streptomyces sp. NPDC047117]|uniref:hypothetical protein n=1 Tax=Streptomyces sp. NPDC047117 TaxID=3155379 RepID=UPI0033FB6EF2